MPELSVSVLLVGAGGKAFWRTDLPAVPGLTFNESCPPGFEITGVTEVVLSTSGSGKESDEILRDEITRLRRELNTLREGNR